jgi:hypothetical protein
MEGKTDAQDIPSLAGDAPRANKADLSRTSTRLLGCPATLAGN